MKPKIFTVLLEVIILCYVLAGTVQAEDYTWTDNGDGTCTITGYGYLGPGGDITIPDTLDGLTVTSIADHAFAQDYSITGLTIPASIISIGEGAFYPTGLTDITVVPANPAYSSLDGVLFNKDQTILIRYPDRKAGDYTVPDSVTVIGGLAFIGCDDLTSIIIPDSVISIQDYAFAYCDSLTCVTIGNSVTSIGYRAFRSCSGLTYLYFKGDSPVLGTEVFYNVNATVYYIPGSAGWGATYEGLPTAVWSLSVADVDMNGDVNLADFAVFAAAWQSSSGDAAYNLACDISDPVDGVINVADLEVFFANWLTTPCP